MMSYILRKEIIIILVIAAGLVTAFTSAFFINSTADKVITVQAERTSIAWANYLGAQLHRIKDIADGADLTLAEQDFLAGARKFGDIFRFKLFDPQGSLRLVSDDLHSSRINTPITDSHSLKAQQVVRTGIPFTQIEVGTLEDGNHKADRPDLYVETYVPVLRNGNLVAVVEVYIDETATSAVIKSDFTLFGLQIAGILLLGFSVPGLILAFMLSVMRQQNEKLRIAEETKSTFLAHMSHELRTPLNSIIGFAQMLTTEQFGVLGNKKYNQYAQFIHDSGAHLLTLINDVLDLSKLEAGETLLNDSNVNVRDALEEVVASLSHQANLRNIRFSVHGAHEKLIVRADPRLCKQVFLNLLGNAIKFSDPNELVVITYDLDENMQVCISIENKGKGIAPEDLERVLEPFGQAHASEETTHEGTGLGLPLSKGLMEKHGGALKIISEQGKKTVVSISFPSERLVFSS